jgi:hypothetical protein
MGGDAVGVRAIDGNSLRFQISPNTHFAPGFRDIPISVSTYGRTGRRGLAPFNGEGELRSREKALTHPRRK